MESDKTLGKNVTGDFIADKKVVFAGSGQGKMKISAKKYTDEVESRSGKKIKKVVLRPPNDAVKS